MTSSYKFEKDRETVRTVTYVIGLFNEQIDNYIIGSDSLTSMNSSTTKTEALKLKIFILTQKTIIEIGLTVLFEFDSDSSKSLLVYSFYLLKFIYSREIKQSPSFVLGTTSN